MKKRNFLIKLLSVCLVLLQDASSTPQLHKASDGREYLIETELKYNWYEAWHECARRGSQLVIIDSAAKNNAIIDLLKSVIGKSHNLWLGGNDEYSLSRDYNRPFFWSATGQKFSFTYWSDYNPDNYRNQEHCVHIWDTTPLYQWNDIECTFKMGFICEVHHYLQACTSDLKQKCDVIKGSSSAISSDFEMAQQQQLAEINGKIQSIDRLKDEWKIEWQEAQNTIHTSIQKILDNQEIMAKQLNEKRLKQINDLYFGLKNSTTDINTQFKTKLNASQNKINTIC